MLVTAKTNAGASIGWRFSQTSGDAICFEFNLDREIELLRTYFGSNAELNERFGHDLNAKLCDAVQNWEDASLKDISVGHEKAIAFNVLGILRRDLRKSQPLRCLRESLQGLH